MNHFTEITPGRLSSESGWCRTDTAALGPINYIYSYLLLVLARVLLCLSFTNFSSNSADAPFESGAKLVCTVCVLERTSVNLSHNMQPRFQHPTLALRSHHQSSWSAVGCSCCRSSQHDLWRQVASVSVAPFQFSSLFHKICMKQLSVSVFVLIHVGFQLHVSSPQFLQFHFSLVRFDFSQQTLIQFHNFSRTAFNQYHSHS